MPRTAARASTSASAAGSRRCWRTTAGAIELMNSPAAVDARHAGDLLRRRDRHGRQHLSRRPRRRAHADAVVARPQRRLLPRRSRARSSLPPIMDPIYGFQAVNVEAQSRDPHSLLNWTRRMIAVRQRSHRPSAAARCSFLYPGNRKVLAYLREHRRRDDPVRRQPVALAAGGRTRPVGIARRGCRSNCSAARPSRRSATSPTC